MLKALSRSVLAFGLVGLTLMALETPSASTTTIQGGVDIWLTPTGHETGQVLLTGAIGDAGKTLIVSSTGHASPNGDFQKLIFQKGTILLDRTTFENNLRHNIPFRANPSNCSYTSQINGSTHIIKGTGIYAGISGDIFLTERIGSLLAKTSSGTCKPNSPANSRSVMLDIFGDGTIK